MWAPVIIKFNKSELEETAMQYSLQECHFDKLMAAAKALEAVNINASIQRLKKK